MARTTARPATDRAPAESSRPTVPDADLARMVDAALAQADAEAPLLDALDDAVDAVGADRVVASLRALAGEVGSPEAERD